MALNKNFKEEGESNISLYISCDSMTSWIGNVSNIEEVHALIHPDNIMEILKGQLSEDELEAFEALIVTCEHDYTFYDEKYNLYSELN